MGAVTQERHWYCVRTQPKHEQIAATHLRRTLGFDVFAPKLRIRKATRRGAVWFHDPLFPGYIFAYFNWHLDSQAIRGARGVSTLVTFGATVPFIPDAMIEALRSQFDATECHEVPESIRQGDVVTIGGGPFHGLQATVLRVLSPSQRIQVLLEIMGGPQSVEIPLSNVSVEKDDADCPAKDTPFYQQNPPRGTPPRSQK